VTMKLRTVFASVVFTLLALACSEPVPTPRPVAAAPVADPPTLTGTVIDSAALKKVAYWYFPWHKCKDWTEEIARSVGPRSISCTDPDESKANVCADAALRKGTPFTVFTGRYGMDSFLSKGIVAKENGAVDFYVGDGMGETFKGTCLRENVLSSPTGWPACKRTLSGMVDLRTCHEHVEWPARYEERWSGDCDESASRIAKIYNLWVLHRVPLIADFEKWNVRCKDFKPSFELIIDPRGNVRCARIISSHPSPPPGLHDEMKKNLMRWKFQPPTIHGVPIELRVREEERVNCRSEWKPMGNPFDMSRPF